MKFDRPKSKLPLLRDKKGINTISDMFEEKTTKYHDLISLSHIVKGGEIKEFTYSEIYEYVTRVSKYLKELGIKKGDHVAIIGENRPEWAISYFAVSWIGAISVPLDARATLDNIKYIIEFSDTSALLLSQSYFESIERIKPNLPNLQHMILMESFDEIISKYSEGIGKENVKPDDLTEILFTSGTAGNQKGIMLSHRNIMSNVEDVYSYLDINPGDRAFSVLPIHHSYEKTTGLITTFYSGITIYYGRGLRPRDLLEDLLAVKPTIWINTPLLLEKLITRVNKELSKQKGIKKILTKILPKKIVGNKIKKQLGLDKLRILASGGAHLQEWVFDSFKQLGITIIQGYGLTEASPVVSANPMSNPKKNSVGMIVQSDEVKIIDPDDENNGEIIVKGPNVMLGYYKNKEATDEVLTGDGWLRTGDIGYFDEDGYLFITGRKKFIIVTPGGKNIFPEEIEEKLTKTPIVEEALIFSPDDREIQAIIFPSLEEYQYISGNTHASIRDSHLYDLIVEEIKNVNKQLESYKRISKFAIKTDEFPKTTTRKIKRYLFKGTDLNNTETYL